MCSCHKKQENTNRDLTCEDFAEWIDSRYSISAQVIRNEIERLAMANHVDMYADAYTRSYYLNKGKYLWITKRGIDNRADTLLNWLKDVDQIGFNKESFNYTEIVEIAKGIRAYDASSNNGTLSERLGRLEYKLTEAYMRYAFGQRFGYIKPHRLFNNLLEDDSVNGQVTYRRIFDIDMDIPTDSFFHVATSKIKKDELGAFLREIQPTSELYNTMLADYKKARANNNEERARLARINMERSRWRYPRPDKGRYLWVNLAGFELTAVDTQKDTAFTMKVCGGDQKHKTPLLYSKITRMELNPYWVIPQTIVRKEIIEQHLGDSAYFARNNIHAINKDTHEEVNPTFLSESQLRSARYTLRQEKGEGNSLGRMIFRFPNQFSVYLHDTNNHNAFLRTVRAVSHGCVRLERPLDIALFLLNYPDEDFTDRLLVSIDKAPKTEKWKKFVEENPEHNPPLSNKAIEPNIPVWLDYYTLYPTPTGELREHPDTYKYDKEIETLLNQF